MTMQVSEVVAVGSPYCRGDRRRRGARGQPPASGRDRGGRDTTQTESAEQVMPLSLRPSAARPA